MIRDAETYTEHSRRKAVQAFDDAIVVYGLCAQPLTVTRLAPLTRDMQQDGNTRTKTERI